MLNGEYLIKFQNEQNLRSASAVSALINIPDGIPRLNREVFREDQLANEFGGEKVGVFYKEEYDGLILDGDASFDAISSLDGFTADIDSHFGTQLVRGEYFFQKTVDLGNKFSVRMQRVLTARGLYTSALIDDRSELIDTWSDFDGLLPDDTNVEMYFRKNLDNTADNVNQNTIAVSALAGNIVQEDGSKIEQEDDVSTIERNSVLEFGAWSPLENNAEAGRFFQFKAVLTTDHVDQTPIVDQLGVTLQLERRTENSTTFSSASLRAQRQTGETDVKFNDAFYTDADTEVTVGITAFELQSGDYYRITNLTGTGFDVDFYNSSNAVIDRNFQYTAIGYGTQQS